MDLDTGKMRDYVTLQRRSQVRDATGEQVDTYTDLGDSFCKILPLSGREYFTASGEASEVTHRIRMRARDDFSLQPRDRVVQNGTRIFDIESVLDIEERGQLWVIMAKELLQTNA